MAKTFDELIAAVHQSSWRDALYCDADGPKVQVRVQVSCEEALADLRDAYEVRERAHAELARLEGKRGIYDPSIILRRVTGEDTYDPHPEEA